MPSRVPAATPIASLRAMGPVMTQRRKSRPAPAAAGAERIVVRTNRAITLRFGPAGHSEQSRRISLASGLNCSSLVILVPHLLDEDNPIAVAQVAGVHGPRLSARRDLEVAASRPAGRLATLQVGAGTLISVRVGALLHDPPVLEDDNEVGPPQRAQAVGHDEGRPALDRRCPSASKISCSVSLSIAAVGSSKRRIAGSSSTARAMASRWRCPPDRLLPLSPSTVS